MALFWTDVAISRWRSRPSRGYAGAERVWRGERAVSPLFGHKEDEEARSIGSAGDAPPGFAAELERVRGLPVTELAAEVMLKGFGPDGPGGPGKPGTLESPGDAQRVGLADIARAVSPGVTGRGVSAEQSLTLSFLIAEALQALEHASLVRLSWRGGFEDYVATRLGRQAVEQDAVRRVLRGEAV